MICLNSLLLIYWLFDEFGMQHNGTYTQQIIYEWYFCHRTDCYIHETWAVVTLLYVGVINQTHNGSADTTLTDILVLFLSRSKVMLRSAMAAIKLTSIWLLLTRYHVT